QRIFNISILHFGLIAGFRLCYLTVLKKLLQNKSIGFNTLVIGNKTKAKNITAEIDQQTKSLGFKIVGFYDIDYQPKANDSLAETNTNSSLQAVIKNSQIEEVIVAIETSEHTLLKSLLDQLEECNVTVHIIPDVYDII